MIEITDLEKSFGEVKAVQGISFQVKKGSLFAFLGVNGAGKSTTIHILCGQLPKDGGTVLVDGKNIETHLDEVKSIIGVVFQDSVLDRAISSYDNLKSRASLYGITETAFEERLEELCLLLDLKEILNRPVGKLSGGQRRRVDIARALFHRPKLLILDEPTTGLDPQTRKHLWEVIRSLQKNEEMTVFLTTHYMEEAGDADRVVILDSGKILAEGTPLELKNRFTGDYISLYNVSEEEVKTLGISYEAIPDGFRLFVPDTRAATQLIVAHPALFSDYEIIKGKMDDVFLNATGKKLGGNEK
ncbi:MAG: ATP-binding cassette domain-containing protein [Clostridia bacterium]|nr:ATP-binding cassette domain-containing protein [Clostridia bacterium]